MDRKVKLNINFSYEVTENCTNLISKMLSLDAGERPTMDELFTNEWVTEIGSMDPRCQNYIELTEEDISQSGSYQKISFQSWHKDRDFPEFQKALNFIPEIRDFFYF